MFVVAAVLLISLALPAASQECSSIRPSSSWLPGPRQAENDGEYALTVHVACLPTQLQITWELERNSEYDADINYICTDSNGTTIIQMNNRVEARQETSGIINTSSVPIEEIIANDGTCTVYGCQTHPATTQPILYNKNVSCRFNFSDGALVLTTENTQSTSTSSSSFETTIPISEASTTQTMSQTEGPSTSYPQSFVTTSLIGTTKSEQDVTTQAPDATTPTSKDEHIIPIIVTSVIAFPVIIVIIILVLITMLINKRKNRRFTHLGSTLNIEKIDPYYTPVQIEPNITKCESMKSIFEYLSLQKYDHPAEPSKLFTLSLTESSKLYQPSQQPLDEVPTKNLYELETPLDEHYVLQPPPQTNHYIKRTVSLESSESSDYHSSLTSLSTLPHQVDTPLHLLASNYYDTSPSHTTSSDQFISSNILFKETPCYDNYNTTTYASSSEDDYGSQSSTDMKTDSGYVQEPHKQTLNESLLLTDSNAEESCFDNYDSACITSNFSESTGNTNRGYIQEPPEQNIMDGLVLTYSSNTPCYDECNSTCTPSTPPTPPMQNNRGYVQETKEQTVNYNDVSLVLTDSEYSITENTDAEDLPSDHRIMLTFPPSTYTSSRDNMIAQTEVGTNNDAKNAEESLTESNLTINPHHFDPL